MKFTRTAYTSLPLSKVLAELVNDAGLHDLPTMNRELYSRRHREERPDQVRVTVIVERVGSPSKKS